MRVRDVLRGRREITAGREAAPRVSIITPTYRRNLEGLLAPCIESALGQTFTDLELIIVDDGSSDGSEETIRRYAAEDDRIRYFRHDRNSGLPAVRTNEGIMLARGEAIAFLFDDNMMAGDFIEKAHAALGETAVDVVHADVRMLARKGDDFTLGDWPLTLDLLGNLNTIPNAGVLCRRDFFDRFGLYDPHILLRRVCDWDLWLRALRLGARFHHIPVAASVEHGLVSENSIGNTVAWDVKVAYGYMFDVRRDAARSARLRPSAIDEIDVLDVDAVLPYVRNADEWADVVEKVYAPFATRNSAAAHYTTSLTNRVAIDSFGFGAPESPSPLAARRRILIVSSTFNETVQTWEQALSSPDTICIHVPEWQMAAVPAASVDVLLLADVCASFVAPLLPLFVDAGVPVLYVSHHGFGARSSPSGRLQERAPIHKLLGTSVYLPEAGVPFDEGQAAQARTIIALADAVVVPADLDIAAKDLSHGWVVRAPADPAPRWFRNVVASAAYRRQRVTGTSERRAPKVVVALNSELLSGSEAYGTMLAHGLAGVGFTVETWVPDPPVYDVEDSALAERLAELGLLPARPAPYAPSMHFAKLPQGTPTSRTALLSEAIRESDPDLVICAGFMPVFAASDRGEAGLVMTLFQPSAYDPEMLSDLNGRIDGWITDCAWSHDVIAGLLPGPSAVVRSTVPPFRDSELARTRPEGPVRIALGGTLQRRKGQVESVRALGLLLDRGYDAVLNLYGYALPSQHKYREAIEAAIAELGLESRVRILGFSDLDTIAADNDIILSASSDESLPQTIAESIARGLVPVVALAGGIDELVIDGSNGFVAAGQAPERLADALERALGEEKAWPLLRRQSALVLSLFAAERSTEALLSFVLETLRPRSTPTVRQEASPGPLFWTPDPERITRVAELRKRKAMLARQNGTSWP